MFECKYRMCSAIGSLALASLLGGLACVSKTETVPEPPITTGTPASSSPSSAIAHQSRRTGFTPWQTEDSVDLQEVDHSMGLEVTTVRQRKDGVFIAHVKLVDRDGAVVSGMGQEQKQACASAEECAGWRLRSESCKDPKVLWAREHRLETSPPVAFTAAVDLSGSVVDSLDEIELGVDAIRDAMRPSQDRLDLLYFDHRSAIVDGRELDDQPIRSLHALFGGGTALWDAAMLGVHQVHRQPQARKVLVLFTDGADTSSFRTHADAANTALDAEVEIVAVGIGQVDADQLVALTDATGGRFYRNADFRQLDDIFREAALVTQHYYEVALECDDMKAGALTVASSSQRGRELHRFVAEDDFEIAAGTRLQGGATDRTLRLMYFATNQSELPDSPHTERRLQVIVAELGLRKGQVALLEGYADAPGTERYNKHLSKQRAIAVRKALIERGADPRRIRVVGHGETRSEGYESDVEYRRVDLRWAPKRGSRRGA